MSDIPDFTDVIEILERGTLEMEGLVPWGSNYTFLVHVCFGEREIDAIYKPGRGERPLWDFTRGTLCLRERAAYLISEALGWRLVPPTILREGPHGWGSVQSFVSHDPQVHYLVMKGDHTIQMQQIALLDAIANNADRKSGHVLLGRDQRLWAIDHGVCFHVDYKLRSVIWEFAGQPIPEHLMDDLAAFQTWLCHANDPIRLELTDLLDAPELAALEQRLNELIKHGTFPEPGPGRHYPWPLV